MASLIQDLVTEYAQKVAKKKKLEQRLSVLHEKLVTHLRKKECPTGGPFIVELSLSDRTTFSWKDYAHTLAQKLWGDRSKKLIKKEQKKAETNEIETLLVKANPEWEE